MGIMAIIKNLNNQYFFSDFQFHWKKFDIATVETELKLTPFVGMYNLLLFFVQELNRRSYVQTLVMTLLYV